MALETEEELSAPSRWKVKTILERRDGIVSVVAPFTDVKMNPEVADGSATEIESYLGWFGTKYPIRNTLLLHTDDVFTASKWRQLAWQIAANEQRLRQGIPLTPFSPNGVTQWVVSEIVGISPSSLANGAEATEIEFLVLTGVNAGFRFKEKLTEPALHSMSRDIGYNRKNKYDGQAINLFGFKLAVKIADGRIERFFCPDKIKAENRLKIRLRRRDVVMEEYDPDFNNDGTPRTRFPLQYGCPYKFEHPCWECDKTTSQCPASYKDQ